MENEVIELLLGILNASEDFTGVVGDIFPLYADEGTEAPFSVYRLDPSENVSKDGSEQFSVSIILVFPPKQYRETIQMKDTVKALLKDTHFSYVTSETDFDPETQLIVSVMIFQITTY